MNPPNRYWNTQHARMIQRKKKMFLTTNEKPHILCFYSKIFFVEASFLCWIHGLMSIMIIKILTKSTEMNMQTKRSTHFLFFFYYWFIRYFHSNAVYSIVVTYWKPSQVSSTLLYNLMETEVLWHSLFPIQSHIFIPFSVHSTVSQWYCPFFTLQYVDSIGVTPKVT